MPQSRPTDARLRAIEACAHRVLTEHALTSLPIDPIALARDKLDIVVEAKPTPGGVSGMLIHAGNSFGIVYSPDYNEGFQRFSVAHELGHYSLDGHIDGVFAAGKQVHESRAGSGFSSSDQYEREADNFAAALLMPARLAGPVADQAAVGLPGVEAVHERCGTSMTSSAIRYVRLTEAPVAVIVSKQGAIDYCFMSDEFREIPDLTWLRKGTPVPTGTATAGFHKDTSNITNGQRREDTCALPDWFGDGPDVEFNEEVVGLGSYGRVLTVLWSDTLVEDWDEE